MSGILGIWNLDGRPVEEALLARASATLAHRGPDGEGMWIHGPVGLACRLFRVTPEASAETQPLVGSSGAVVVFDGRLDNREELLASLGPSAGVTPQSPDPDLVLAAYGAFGDRLAERLNGDFALGLFDPNRRHLLLARDAIGVRPLYYCQSGETFLFGSEIKALLAHPHVSTRPNDDVLADFLLDGPRDTQGMTFFKDVFSLLPAHVAILSRQGLVTRRYWDFDSSGQTRFTSFDEYTAAFRLHFDQAVRRRLRSQHPVAVSVSGGLDSSSIFCLATTLARRNPGRFSSIIGLSYTSADGSPSDEKAFLVEMERRYGVAFERVPVSPMGPMNGSRESVWHVEIPFLDEQWDTTHTFMSAVRRQGARVLLTGHWADQVLFDQAYLVDLFHHLRWREVRAHLQEFGRWLTDTDPAYFRRRFSLDLIKYSLPGTCVAWLRRLRPRRHRPWYSEGLRNQVQRRRSGTTAVRRPFPTAHARSLYEQARSGHHVQCMEWDNKVAAMHGLEMAFPFLDRDLLSFLMGIPGEMQTGRGVPKALLRAAMQDVLPDAIARRTWKADFSHLVNEGMERDFPQLVRCLESDGLAVRLGYLDGTVLRDELRRMKDRIRGPECEISWGLSDLLGLEIWLQIFLGGSTSGAVQVGFPEWSMRAAEQGGAL
jgi:asparagine synthase (glutamine-hydrolysing)